MTSTDASTPAPASAAPASATSAPAAPARLVAGDVAPAFSLPASDGSTVSLGDYTGRRLIIFFYPEAATPACTKEACDFRDSVESLRSAGYEVVGISRDDPAKLADWRAEEGITYPLLSDPDLAAHNAFRAYGEKSLYGKTVTGVLRSTFVVETDGTLSWALYNVRATGHVAALRKKLKLA